MVDKEYFAFISYKSEDVEWATWLQHELEHYHLPASFNGRTDVPQKLHPVFRDIDELSAGNLPEQIKQALTNSQNLIVICSPQSAKSPWVNQEVETFISLGRTDHIFPFIVEGNSSSEFFPPALLNLPKDEERLGGDVSKKGRDAAFVKVVAGMLGVGFDSLWNRYEKEKAEEERVIREHRDKLLRIQSLFLAEKSTVLLQTGDSRKASILALEALPHNLDQPERPYVDEAMQALMNSFFSKDCLEYDKSVQSAVFSPKGEVIATISGSTIRLLDSELLQCKKFIEVNQCQIVSIVYRPDGRQLASASKDGTIQILNANTGMVLFVLKSPMKGVLDITYSYDGKYLISAHNEGIIIWDSENGIFLRSIDNIFGVIGIASSPVSSTFATISWECAIKIWDINTGRLIKKMGRINGEGAIPQDQKKIRILLSSRELALHKGIAYSPNGQHIVTTSFHNLYMWNVDNGTLLHHWEIPNISEINSAIYSPDGKSIALATRGQGILIWSAQYGGSFQRINTIISEYDFATFNPNGKKIVGISDGVIHLRDVRNSLCLYKYEGHTNSIQHISVNPKGNIIVSASSDKTVKVWDVLTNQEIKILTWHHDTPFKTAISPQGQYVMSISNSECIVWNKDTYAFIRRISTQSILFVDAGFGGKENQFYTVCCDGTVKIWELESGECIYTELFMNSTISEDLEKPLHIQDYLLKMDKHIREDFYSNYKRNKLEKEFTVCAAFCDLVKMQSVLLTGNGIVRIWDMKSKKILHSYKDKRSGSKSISVNSDMSLVTITCTEDKKALIWNVETMEIRVLEGHHLGINSSAFSPDGKRIATASKDDSVIVWDVHDGEILQILQGEHWDSEQGPIEILEGHFDDVTSVVFSPDGKNLFSASRDKTIIKWYSPSFPYLLKKAIQRNNRYPLTQDERKAYYLD